MAEKTATVSVAIKPADARASEPIRPTAAKVDRSKIKGGTIEQARTKLTKFLSEQFGDPEGTLYHRAQQPTFIFFSKSHTDTINHPSDSVYAGRPRYEWQDSAMDGVQLGTLINYDGKGPRINPDLTSPE